MQILNLQLETYTLHWVVSLIGSIVRRIILAKLILFVVFFHALQFIVRLCPLPDYNVPNDESNGSYLVLQYRTLTPMYYHRAAAAIIVYDITSRDSFNYVKNWVNELNQYEPNCSVIAIVGNKCDLEERREVSDQLMYQLLFATDFCSKNIT